MIKKITTINLLVAAFLLLAMVGCQKFSKPAMGPYPVDANPPGGPLKFYEAFDGTTTNSLMNAVDSVRASFPISNPLSSTDGIKGKGVLGATGKYIVFPKPNDWVEKQNDFTVAVWFKKNGQTLNNKGTNGPEYFVSLKAQKDYHWSNATFFFFLEGDNTACAVKTEFVDAGNPPSIPQSDNWFTWESAAEKIPGLLNNQWHHIAIVYTASNSSLTLYIDGVANPNVKKWGSHGHINLDVSKIAEMRVGAGPNTDATGDDWLASTWKGSLDQFRMYGTALTAAEIKSLFDNKL